MEYSYDAEADALTIIFLPGQKSSKTLEIDDARYIDLNSEGEVAAIEVLWASHGFTLRDLVDRFDLWDYEIELKELQNTRFEPAVAL